MKKIVLAVSIPVFALLLVAGYHEYLSRVLPEYTFAIEGYDPRDLISGHYLRFRIKYDVSTKCSKETYYQAFMCVHPNMKVMEPSVDTDCKQWIRGQCQGGTFRDELQRIYVPETKAKSLEQDLLNGKASIRVSVGQGNAVIKDLLIDGKSWQDK